jgi:hypothetical protein
MIFQPGKYLRIFYEGLGNIYYDKPSSGGSGTLTAAQNGLSVSGGNTVVLGQDIDQAGNPGKLINDREIPTQGSKVLYIRNAPNDAIGFTEKKISFQDHDTTAGGYINIEIQPIHNSQPSQVNWNITRINVAQASVPDNEIINMGFNFLPNAARQNLAVENMGWSMESNYRPSAPTLVPRFWEWHQVFTDIADFQYRLSSYTINTGAVPGTTPLDIDFYFTASRMYIKAPVKPALGFIPWAVDGIGTIAISNSIIINDGVPTVYQWLYNNQGINISNSTGDAAGTGFRILGFNTIQLGNQSQVLIVDGAATFLENTDSFPVRFVQGFGGSHYCDIQVLADILTFIPSVGNAICVQSNATSAAVNLRQGGGVGSYGFAQATGTVFFGTNDTYRFLDNTGLINDFFIDNLGIITRDPGSGAGKYLWGKYLALAVTVDLTHYVEVKIDGTLRKLAVCN